MCIVQGFEYFINYEKGFNPCSAKVGDLIDVSMYITFAPADVGKTAVDCVSVTFPDGLGYEFCSSPFHVTVAQTETITINLNAYMTQIGSYPLYGVFLRSAPGTPPLCYSVSSSGGCNVLQLNPPACPVPVADFGVSVSGGTVVFTDLSQNNPASLSWDFGTVARR